MITGEHVGLRAIEEGDLETLLRWRNRPDYRTYFREVRELSMADQRRWYHEVVLTSPAVRMFAITTPDNARLLGACGLCYIDPVRRSADFSIYIGAEDLYIDDVYAPEAGRLLLNYGFQEMNLHRIWAEIYDHDTRKQALLPDLGFTLEGRLKDHHFTNGQFVDSLMYGQISPYSSTQK